MSKAAGEPQQPGRLIECRHGADISPHPWRKHENGRQYGNQDHPEQRKTDFRRPEQKSCNNDCNTYAGPPQYHPALQRQQCW